MPTEFIGSLFTPRRLITVALYAIAAAAIFAVHYDYAEHWLPGFGKLVGYALGFACFFAAASLRKFLH